MVTRTAGRLLAPRLVTTSGGTRIPVAVLPLSWMMARNFIRPPRTEWPLAVWSRHRCGIPSWGLSPDVEVFYQGRATASALDRALPWVGAYSCALAAFRI